MVDKIERRVAYLNYLGVSLNINDFWSRFRVQKAIFLAESLTSSNASGFSLYAHGPYSPELTREYYAESEKFKTGVSTYLLSDEEKLKLDKIKDSIKDLSTNKLEAFATAVYLIKGRCEIKELANQIKIIKPFLTSEDILIGVNMSETLFKN